MLHRAFALSCLLILPAIDVQGASLEQRPPATELATGSVKLETTRYIRAGTGCTTITILGIGLEKCPPIVFGNYGQDRSGANSSSASAGGSSSGNSGGGGSDVPSGGGPGGSDNPGGGGSDDPSDSPGGNSGGVPGSGQQDCRQ